MGIKRIWALILFVNFPDLGVIEEILGQVKQIYDRVRLAQANVEDLCNGIMNWANQPLYERKDNKKENLLNLDDRAERIQKRRDLVTACSNDLQRIIKENCVLFLKTVIEEKPPEVLTEPEQSPTESPDEKKGKGINIHKTKFTIGKSIFC